MKKQTCTDERGCIMLGKLSGIQKVTMCALPLLDKPTLLMHAREGPMLKTCICRKNMVANSKRKRPRKRTMFIRLKGEVRLCTGTQTLIYVVH